MAYVVACNQGAQFRHYPPFSWPGSSMIVDYDGHILAQADAGPGQKIVVGPIDIPALRSERERRCGHHMLSHLRNECDPAYQPPLYPQGGADKYPLSVERNERLAREAKHNLNQLNTRS